MTDLERAEPIAVTVIGGYLGSGKTTLVNHLLRTATEPIAVLVNDFGEINIDAELITSSDGDTMELANGCICCSLVDGFAAALTSIGERQPPPARLVIEASGVADPASVAAYAHTPGFTLDAVVVLADAETIRSRSTDRYVGDTVRGQLSSADVVVVNKIDLVEPQTVTELEAWLGEGWPDAFVFLATQSVVPPELLFGLVRTDQPDIDPSPAGPDDHGHGHDDHDSHDHGGSNGMPAGGHFRFSTWSVVADGLVDRAAVEAAMAALPDGVVRVKGTLHLTDDPDRPHLLQRVGHRWTLRPHPTAGSSSGSGGVKLVAIGIPDAIDDHWLAAQLGLT